MPEQISSHPQIPHKEYQLIEFWIKLWGTLLVLWGLSTVLIKAPWDITALITACGLFLIFGKRIQLIRKILLWFTGFMIGATGTWAIYNTKIEFDRVRAVYFSISCLFNLGLFTFLLRPDVKTNFGSLAPPHPLPSLTSEEERRIKFWVRIVAIGILTESLYYRDFQVWIRNPFSILTIGLAISLIIFFSLFYFRENLGRKLGLFFSALAIIDTGVSLTQPFRYNIFKYLLILTTFFFYAGTSFFLMHPKTKAVFK